jgi:hypothetical protein
MLCSTQKTCFVFQEFNILFAICRSCYDSFVEHFKTYEVVTDFCVFCENERPCKVIASFDNTMFFTQPRICDECAEEMVEKVSVHDV